MKSSPVFKNLQDSTFQWLKALGISVNKSYLTDEITTHADYPAISALADFLDSGNMEYNAVEADASYIHEFQYPLLAHIRSAGGGRIYAPGN